jgi:hypothetical protein
MAGEDEVLSIRDLPYLDELGDAFYGPVHAVLDVPARELEGRALDIMVTVQNVLGTLRRQTYEIRIAGELPAGGVCCPVVEYFGCGHVPGTAGGWAPSLDLCEHTSTDAAYFAAADEHGCQILVEDTTACCGCIDR